MFAADGNVYDGEWLYDYRNGNGKMTYMLRGQVYDGYWKSDKWDGKGKMTYANDDVYDGEWADNYHHGNGKMTYANGDVYEGEWKDGKKYGKGKMTYKNGTVCEGEWNNDTMEHKLVAQKELDKLTFMISKKRDEAIKHLGSIYLISLATMKTQM